MGPPLQRVLMSSGYFSPPKKIEKLPTEKINQTPVPSVRHNPAVTAFIKKVQIMETKHAMSIEEHL
jgi:hypothetical protein